MTIFLLHLKICSGYQYNLRSGPILAVLIHSLLPAPSKIGPDTNSLTFVLTAARFWPQHWLAVGTMLQDLIGCWNQWKLKGFFFTWLIALKNLCDDPPSAERKILLSFFIVLRSRDRKICLNMCQLEIQKI